MNNKMNYEIDNCTTDLDTLIALDKRAIRDLENNTHEIEQHEVLTIIREFIRLRNDYKKEKEKNKGLEIKASELNGLAEVVEKYYIHKDKIKDFVSKKMKYLYVDSCAEDSGKYTAYKNILNLLEEK